MRKDVYAHVVDIGSGGLASLGEVWIAGDDYVEWNGPSQKVAHDPEVCSSPAGVWVVGYHQPDQFNINQRQARYAFSRDGLTWSTGANLAATWVNDFVQFVSVSLAQRPDLSGAAVWEEAITNNKNPPPDPDPRVRGAVPCRIPSRWHELGEISGRDAPFPAWYYATYPAVFVSPSGRVFLLYVTRRRSGTEGLALRLGELTP